MNKGRGVKKDFQEQFQEKFGKGITEFERFNDVLSQLGTNTTKQRYINELPRFFIAIDKNPDEVVEERVADIESSSILEADRYGMHLMQKAGYNPKAALWLQEYFASQ